MKPLRQYFTCSVLFRSSPSKRVSLWAMAALLSVTAESALAWTVYNNTSYKIRASISQVDGGATKCGDWDDDSGKEIAAGQNASVSYTDTTCNPTGKRDSYVRMHIKIDNTGADAGFARGEGRFSCFVDMLGGGFVLAYQQERSGFSDSAITPNVYCVSLFAEDKGYDSPDCSGNKDLDYNKDGKCTEIAIDWSDPFNKSLNPSSLAAMTPANRNIRFLATGDPQYWNSAIDNGVNTGINKTSDAVMAKMKALVQAEQTSPPEQAIRGMIISGDLTQNARDDERERYEASIESVSRYVFEGLGNHDIDITGSSSHPNKMADLTGKKSRNTFPTKRPDSSTGKFPHYSWDWHDVHFVQLDLFPADDPAGKGYDSPDLDPGNALDFLKNDLSENVGSTGRPIVLVHHYGFDCFSLGNLGGCSAQSNPGWWSDAQRLAYWNAIKNYNVIAIITGHAHIDAGNSGWRKDFDKPVGADSRADGKSSIPAFIAGAARGALDDANLDIYDGGFLDVTIDSCNQFIVQRKSDAGTVLDTDKIDFKTVGWGSENPDCTVDAKCKADFTVATDLSCSASTSIDAGSTGLCTQSPAGPYGLGTTVVELNCTSLLGTTDLCKTNVTVEDRTPPEQEGIAVPTVLECGKPLNYSFDPPQDNCDSANNLIRTCTPDSSALAKLGDNNISCTLTDTANNRTDFSFLQVSEDTLPPELLSPPSDKTVECTGTVTPVNDVVDASTVPTATDLCDADLQIMNDMPATFKLGETKINWTIHDDSNHKISTSNVITIVDTTGPKIRLDGANPVRLECGVDKYNEPGFTVNDLCDSSPRSKVLGTGTPNVVGDYSLVYTAQDGSGNQTEATRVIRVEDTTKPVVQLKGDNPLFQECGTRYREPGAAAMDACDGALPVTIQGEVDTNALGTQIVNYGAKDARGLAETVQRLVFVQDTTAPRIQCPVDAALDPQSSEGRIVNYPLAIARDRCDATPNVACVPPPGSTFAIGTTTNVQCSAWDGTGNEASCAFSVTIYSVAEVIQNMQALIVDLGAGGAVTPEQAQTWNDLLGQVLQDYDNNETILVCGKLQIFKNIIRGLVTDGVLTTTQAQPLVTSADNLGSTFGCGL